MQKHKRKILVVDNPLQARVIKDVGVAAATVLTVSVLVVGWFAHSVVSQIQASGAEVPGLVPLLLAVFGCICLTSFALMMRALKVSHAVAGPQFAIRRSVDQFLAGDHHVRVRIRGTDYLHSVADDINRVLDMACGAPSGPSEQSAETGESEQSDGPPRREDDVATAVEPIAQAANR